jgi:hypothetical protein
MSTDRIAFPAHSSQLPAKARLDIELDEARGSIYLKTSYPSPTGIDGRVTLGSIAIPANLAGPVAMQLSLIAHHLENKQE